MAFRKKLASILEPAVNNHLKTLDAKSLDGRRDIAAWINEITRDLDLCVVADGKPALFDAELKDARRPLSSRYVVLIPQGRRFTKIEVDDETPHLTLDAAPEGIDEILREVRRFAYHGRSY